MLWWAGAVVLIVGLYAVVFPRSRGQLPADIRLLLLRLLLLKSGSGPFSLPTLSVEGSPEVLSALLISL